MALATICLMQFGAVGIDDVLVRHSVLLHPEADHLS